MSLKPASLSVPRGSEITLVNGWAATALLKRVADEGGEPQAGHILVSAGRLEETRGVEQLPLDVEIDTERLLVTGQEALAGIGTRENAPIEDMYFIQRRFQVQSRTVLRAVDLAETRAQRDLTLVDDVTRSPQQQRGQSDAQRDEQPRRHQRSARSRPRSPGSARSVRPAPVVDAAPAAGAAPAAPAAPLALPAAAGVEPAGVAPGVTARTASASLSSGR